MTKEQYNRWSEPFRKHPKMTQALLFGNKVLTGICYLLYPLLLVLHWIAKDGQVLRTFLTAGISFVAVSLFRRIYHKPRPYEALDIEQIIPKNTKGKSFPSRHVFSVFIIAMCWMFYMPIVGFLLCIVGVVMGILRVCGGVHYPIDVCVGMILGMISGIIGYVIIP